MGAPPLESASRRGTAGSWLVGALAVAALALGILQVAWPWIVDDAFISLRFAERFAEGSGLTWNDGERVEGYSNLLWVLATAALCRLGVDGTTAVRALGVACTVATLAVLLASRVLPPALPARLAVVVLASLAITSTWSASGLEGPLVMLLIALGFANTLRAIEGGGDVRRDLRRAGIAFALLAWTRPDGPLWAAVAAGAVLLCSPRGSGRVRTIAPLLALPALAIGAQLAFRLVYYGDWLPNTAHAKLGTSAASRGAGLAYLASNAVAMRALLLPAALALVAACTRGARRGVAVLAGLGVGCWWLYVLLIGGDTFPRGRQLVPSLVPLTLLAAHGIAWIANRGRAGRAAAWTAAVLCVALAGYDARRANDDVHQRLSTWEWYGWAAGEWLAHAFGDAKPLLAVDAAGAVPYFSRLPCLDMLGICDRTIARTPFPTDSGFVAGHNRANGAYVLARAPDLVMFGPPPGTPRPQWLGDRQLEDDPRFLAEYRLVRFDAGVFELPTGWAVPIRILVWTRLSGRLGFAPASAARTRTLPGFWLCSWLQTYSLTRAEREPAAFDRAMVERDVQAGAHWLLADDVVAVADGAAAMPVAEVRRAGRHAARRLSLAPGRYRVGSSDLPDGARLALQSPDGRSLAADANTWIVPADAAAAGVDLVVDVPASVAVPFRIRNFVFELVE